MNGNNIQYTDLCQRKLHGYRIHALSLSIFHIAGKFSKELEDNILFVTNVYKVGNNDTVFYQNVYFLQLLSVT